MLRYFSHSFTVVKGIICAQIYFLNTATTQKKHPFNGPFSGTTQVSRYQKGKTNLDFTEASGSGISWAICKSASRSRQITTPTTHHSVFTGRMPFLPPNQQRQSTEGHCNTITSCNTPHNNNMNLLRLNTVEHCFFRCTLISRFPFVENLWHFNRPDTEK